MSRVAFALDSSSEASPRSATVCRGPCSTHSCVLYVEGPLRSPITCDLRVSVRNALQQGKRRLVLDLKHVSQIDAAGIGELMRAYNMTVAAEGVLRIQNTPPWIQQVLELVGVFSVLTNGDRSRPLDC